MIRSKKVTLTPAKDMVMAELYSWKPVPQPRAVLVLAPGYNGNAEYLIRQPAWQDFAKPNQLGLVGLSFASDEELFRSGRGYYYASQGSGDLLLEGLRKVFGKDLPVLLYGFSGGAHFTSRFTEWKPERVLRAYSLHGAR